MIGVQIIFLDAGQQSKASEKGRPAFTNLYL